MSLSFVGTSNATSNASASIHSSEKVLTYRLLVIIGVCLGVSSLPALLGRQLIAEVASLHHLAASSSPYFQVSHAWPLYVLAPLVSVSGMVLFLTPGALLVLAFGRVRNALEWVLLAFGSSIVLTILLGSVAKILVGPPLTTHSLLLLWLGTAGLAWLFLAFRLSKEAEICFPLTERAQVRRLFAMLAAALLGVAALTPKIFWENFNLDGIEAFEFGRSLTTHLLPRWEIQDGIFGFYHNFVLFAYPNHWFITLFGPIEASVRLPFILYLVVLFAALILLIELRSPRLLSWLEEAVIWLGLALYTVVQAFNTNYEPFFADLAEMAATDTLVIALFLSSCYLLWTNRFAWFWAVALMTCLAGPGALLLFVALAAVTLIVRPENWWSIAKTTVLFICAWVLVGLSYELLYNRLVLDGINNQFSARNMLRRLYPPTFTEFARFNALLFPCGVIPLLSFLAVKRKDFQTLMVVGVTLIYFVVMYLQAWTSLHQFTPIMVLPLVVFWRIYLQESARMQRWLLPAVASSIAVCLYLSIPQHFQINNATREFGQATEYRIGDYENQYELAANAGKNLSALLPEDYRMRYPEQPWGTDSFTWLYYATREKASGTKINYIIQPTSEPPPTSATAVLTKDGISVYVRDFASWQKDRAQEVPKVVVSPLYEPILRRTYEFFRDYVATKERKTRGQ